MHRRSFVVSLGTAFGAGLAIALAAGPTAVADTGTSPVDTWPYGEGNVLDGTAQGDVAAQGTTDGVTFNWTTSGPDTGPWYTADVTNSSVPDLYNYSSQDVTGVLDSSFGYPTVGTTATEFQDFYVPVDHDGQTEEVPMFNDYRIDDPHLGTADETSMFFGGFSNLYVSDAAGTEDQVTFLDGQPITLFDFPAAGSP